MMGGYFPAKLIEKSEICGMQKLCKKVPNGVADFYI